jgi:hypothetical protein
VSAMLKEFVPILRCVLNLSSPHHLSRFWNFAGVSKVNGICTYFELSSFCLDSGILLASAMLKELVPIRCVLNLSSPRHLSRFWNFTGISNVNGICTCFELSSFCLDSGISPASAMLMEFVPVLSSPCSVSILEFCRHQQC